MLTAKELIEFEEKIAAHYESGKISAPVHLRDGNEEILVDLFKKFKMTPEDYVYSTWASHLHALLKGIHPDRVEKDILEGRSITLHYADHNFFSSAIVAGISPIAVGTAMSIKKQDKKIEYIVSWGIWGLEREFLMSRLFTLFQTISQ